MEQNGTKSVPHTVAFDDLDVQRTTDTNAVQGFRFVVRNEPIDQWLKHHQQQPAARHRKNGAGSSIAIFDGWGLISQQSMHWPIRPRFVRRRYVSLCR